VWEGAGHGEYRTIEPFDYREQTEFDAAAGRNLVHYRLDDWVTDGEGNDVRPSHLEVGIIALKADRQIEC
jgi:hypothetical protein